MVVKTVVRWRGDWIVTEEDQTAAWWREGRWSGRLSVSSLGLALRDCAEAESWWRHCVEGFEVIDR